MSENIRQNIELERQEIIRRSKIDYKEQLELNHIVRLVKSSLGKYDFFTLTNCENLNSEIMNTRYIYNYESLKIIKDYLKI